MISRRVCIILTVLFCISLIPWTFISAFSSLAFERGNTIDARILVNSIFLYPLSGTIILTILWLTKSLHWFLYTSVIALFMPGILTSFGVQPNNTIYSIPIRILEIFFSLIRFGISMYHRISL